MQRVSVALCTYNGERYLREQLDSIVRQIRMPDEVVIGDDGSTDGTLAVVANWIRSSPGPEVRVLERSSEARGVANNFQRTIEACRGDLIVLSDQDDRWKPDRVVRTCQAFEDDPGLLAVFSDASLIDCAGQPLRGSLWGRVGFTNRMRWMSRRGRLFEVLLRRSVATGATMAIRSTLRDVAFPMPGSWLHDEWLTGIASAMDAEAPIMARLICYRLHDENQVGLPTSRDRARTVTRTGWQGLEDQILRWTVLQERLQLLDLHRPASAAQRKVEHLRSRAAASERGFSMVANELFRGRYRRYSSGWRSALADLARMRGARVNIL